MKRLMLIGFLSLFSSIVATADQAQTTITFIGKIVEPTCNIDTDQLKQTISLGEFSVNDFLRAGTTSTRQNKFVLMMRECSPGITGAKIKFGGNKAGERLFALNNGKTQVQDIGLALHTDTNEQIIPNGIKHYKLKAKEDNPLSFKLSLQSIKDVVSAASLNGTITLDIEYE